MKLNKLVILALGVFCLTASVHATTVGFPQLVITTTQGGSGVSYASNTTSMTMDATASDVETAGNVFINVTQSNFLLNVNLSTGVGTLTIGSLLSADFTDFVFTPSFTINTTGNTGNFEATLNYTGGDLAGLYAGGTLLGSAHSVSTVEFSDPTWTLESIQARIGPVDPATVIPVPAAVWLFGSGLLGLAGVARRKR